MKTSEVIMALAIMTSSAACNGKFATPSDAGSDGAPGLPRAMCKSSDGGSPQLCPQDAPVCVGVGYHVYTDAGVSGAAYYQCIPLGVCASDPTCTCLDKILVPSYCAATTAGSCRETDAGIQVSCSGG